MGGGTARLMVWAACGAGRRRAVLFVKGRASADMAEVVPLPGAADGGVPSVPGVVASAAVWAVPWVALGVLVLLVVLLVLRLRLGRARKVRQQRAVDTADAAALARQGAPT